MSGWLVGVDAGGTNTRAAAANPDTGEMRTGHAEGANWTVHGPDLCRERIGRAVSEALPEGASPAAVCLCIAGYYPPDHREAAEGWARAFWPGCPVRVEPDVVAAWAGAFGGEPGIVLVSGTGSICYGRNSKGEEARAGGWGPLFGDDGSAYAVGLFCLRELSRQVDRGEELSPLGRAVMRRWPELGADLRSWLRGVYAHRWGREQVAAVAAEAVKLEEDSEDVGLMLELAATDLADLAATVAERLDEDALSVVVQGGLAQNSRLLRESLHKGLSWVRGENPLPLVEAKFSSLNGALLLAAEAEGGAEAVRRLRDQLSARSEAAS